MSEIDFTMTYPCYCAVQPTGSPFTFNAEGDDCISIFSDGELLDSFFDNVNPNVQPRVRATIEDQEMLCDFLRSVDGQRIAKGRPVTHILIDPTVQARRARTYSIRAFVAHLEGN